MDFPLLKELAEASGPPGHEGPVRAILRRCLDGAADEMTTDALGNLIVRKGSGPLRVMLDAHMDEVGLVVSGFTDDGFIRFKKSGGGILDEVLPGRAYWVGPGRLPGVIGLRALHVTRDREALVESDELYIDIGVRSRAEAEALVNYGDPVVWATECEQWGGKVKARALDDRAGCALLAELLRGPSYPTLTVYGVFSVMEEVGARGARVAAHRLAPHVAVVLETTSAGDVPGAEPHRRVTEQGKGPAISWLDGGTIVPEALQRHLAGLAERHGIPWQPRRSATAGTDAGAIHLARAGIPAAAVSLPGRYIHTPAGLIDIADYDHTLALVQRFLESLDRGEYRP